MVKRREKTKRDELQLSIEIYEKRYQAKDFTGQLLAEYTSSATKLRFVESSYWNKHIFYIIFCLDLLLRHYIQTSIIINIRPAWHLRNTINGILHLKTIQIFIITCRTIKETSMA